jgi:hypothetical protein
MATTLAGEEALLIARENSDHGSGLSTPRSSNPRMSRFERAAGSFALEEALFLAQSRAREAEEAMSCYDQRWAKLMCFAHGTLHVLASLMGMILHSF